MSSPAVEALELEGGLSVLSSQLKKVKGLKTKKLNTWRKTTDRFKVDQNNLELWSALQLHKETAEDYGTAYELLMEACLAGMQEELEKSEVGTVSPLVAKMAVAETELGAYVADKEELEASFYRLAGSFHERQKAENSLVAEKSRAEHKPDTKKVKSADAIKPPVASLKLSPTAPTAGSKKATF